MRRISQRAPRRRRRKGGGKPKLPKHKKNKKNTYSDDEDADDEDKSKRGKKDQKNKKKKKKGDPDPPNDPDKDDGDKGKKDKKEKKDNQRKKSPSPPPSSSQSSSSESSLSSSTSDSSDSSSGSDSSSERTIKGKKEAEKIASVSWPTVSQIEEFTIKVAKGLVQASPYGDDNEIKWLLKVLDPKSTFKSLADSGRARFRTLDNKLASMLGALVEQNCPKLMYRIKIKERALVNKKWETVEMSSDHVVDS